MTELAKLAVDTNEVVTSLIRVRDRLLQLAEAPGEAPGGDRLRVNSYVPPVAPPTEYWYIAQHHTYPAGRHTGLDINIATGGDTDLGQGVYSTCNGVVVYARQAPGAYWGNIVIVMSRDDDGLIFWRYAHLNEVRAFEGMHVLAGGEIGTIGKGGRDRYWAHLHLDAWRGAMATPGAYLSRNVQWVDPLIVWSVANYSFKWGVRK